MPWAIVCIILYPVGVNLLYVALLWMNRADIRLEKDSTAIDAKAKKANGTMIGFLHHPWSANYFWWEAVDSVCPAMVQHVITHGTHMTMCHSTVRRLVV